MTVEEARDVVVLGKITIKRIGNEEDVLAKRWMEMLNRLETSVPFSYHLALKEIESRECVK